MKKTFLCGLMLATAISGNAYAQNIFEALSQAYETNPTLQAQRAYLRAIDENVAIAKSGYRPTVSVNGNYTDTNTDVKNSVGNPDGSQYAYSAKISQPLFNGLQTVNSVKSADSMVLSEQNNLYNVEQTVFIDASTAYLDVVQNKAIVDLQKNNEKLLKKRLDETVQRFNVGEVTRTDVSQARARYARAKADRISSEGTLEASRQSMPKSSVLPLLTSRHRRAKLTSFCPRPRKRLLNMQRSTTILSARPRTILILKTMTLKPIPALCCRKSAWTASLPVPAIILTISPA